MWCQPASIFHSFGTVNFVTKKLIEVRTICYHDNQTFPNQLCFHYSDICLKKFRLDTFKTVKPILIVLFLTLK